MPRVYRSLALRIAAQCCAGLVFALLALELAPAQGGTPQPSTTVTLAQQEPFPVPAEVFEKLTPEERARLLASVVRKDTSNFWLIIIFLLLVGLLTAVIFLYTFRLHANFMKICTDNGQAALFAQSPAGLPTGTIRSLIAFFIVLTAVFLILLTIRGGPFEGFPEVLGGVLGTVLGFYFGSRTASSASERETAHEVSELTAQRNQANVRAEVSEQRNQAIVQGEATRLDRALATVQEGLLVANTIKEVLPEGLRGSAEAVIGKVQGGLRAVEGLKSSGSVGEAVEKAIGLAKDVGKEGGIAALLVKAAGSFGVALGGTVPPLALAVTIATVAARLSGAAYQRWVARVMDAPYTPALFPPTAIDANTGFVLLRRSPKFAAAFAPEIQQGDRAFILDFVQTALSDTGSEAIRDKYPGRFTTLQEIDTAVQEFQQAAIEMEVSKDLTGEMVADVNGVEPLMRAIDRINAAPEARADMDTLVLMIDRLQKAGQPVEKLVRNARQEVEG
jgi:hypothetical protein